ncbi:MAG: sigma-70 family RNA polymerase sigma factor [Pirellulaceae bacterium]|nr:sigma-70 family RNA polymerase sigma factor [Pirellulaceae bacterium]
MHVKKQRPHQGGIGRIEAYRPSLLRMAESRLDRQLRTKLDADDIVQEAMVKAYLGLGQLRAIEEPLVVRNWLRRILTRVLSDQRKRFFTARRDIRREYSGSPNQPSGTVGSCQSFASDHTPPSQAAQRTEEVARILERLARLPSDMRQVMTWYYLEGKTVTEIARLSDRTVDSIAGLLRRGTDKLRDATR